MPVIHETSKTRAAELDTDTHDVDETLKRSKTVATRQADLEQMY